MFVTCGSKNSLFYVFDSLSNLDCGQWYMAVGRVWIKWGKGDEFRQISKKKNVFAFKGCTCRFKSEAFASFASIALRPCDINFGSDKVIQWVPWRHKVLTNGQERLFRKVTSVSIHSFVEWLDTFSYVLQPADVTVKEVNHIRRFAIDIAKDLILLSCRLAMEHLCVLQLETALAMLVTTWFTLADSRWRSRYRSSDQCILNTFRSPERYNGWFREQLGQRFTFFNFCSMMMDNAWNFL
jgi:hypothetical protein